MVSMINTILRNSFFLLVVLQFGCNPCDNSNGEGDIPDFIFYQTISNNRNLIFRYDFENFLIKDVNQDYQLGESYNKDKTLFFNKDSIFLLNTLNLNSSLIFDNIIDLEVRSCILNQNGDIFLIRTLNNQLFKSDLLYNLEFLDANLLENEIELDFERIYYWKKNNNQILASMNIFNSNLTSIELNLELEKISDLSFNSQVAVFSNYDDKLTKVYYVRKNLSRVDSVNEINLPSLKPIFWEDDLFYYNSDSILSEELEIVYISDEYNDIEKIKFNKKLSLVFIYLKDKLTKQTSIYYFRYKNDSRISNLNLLINNAIRVD
jgi:hypothetical protein